VVQIPRAEIRETTGMTREVLIIANKTGVLKNGDEMLNIVTDQATR